MPTTDTNAWFVYILRCKDNTLYTGITNDIDKRLQAHNTGSRSAAKYTRGRRPVMLVYCEEKSSHTEAAQREYEIKKLSRQDKIELLRDFTSAACSVA